MSHPDRPDNSHANELRTSFALPPELAEYLQDQEYACITQATDKGTAFVMKLPSGEIASVRGNVPIQIRQELYDHPLAPVIRIVLTIYDQPQTPLALETYINIADEQQRADFVALESQEQVILLFYDEALKHQLTKVTGYHGKEVVGEILQAAEFILQAIPEEQFDFDQAKDEVMARTSL